MRIDCSTIEKSWAKILRVGGVWRDSAERGVERRFSSLEIANLAYCIGQCFTNGGMYGSVYTYFEGFQLLIALEKQVLGWKKYFSGGFITKQSLEKETFGKTANLSHKRHWLATALITTYWLIIHPNKSVLNFVWVNKVTVILNFVLYCTSSVLYFQTFLGVLFPTLSTEMLSDYDNPMDNDCATWE